MRKETIGKVNIYLGDCMDFMRDLPDNFYDLAIVDPPYGIGWDGESSMAENSSVKWSSAKKTGYKKKQWDSERPSLEYFKEIGRVSKNQIIWGGNYFSDLLPPTGGWIVWEKGVPGDMTLSQAELAYNTSLNSVRIVKLLWAGFRKCEDAIRIHPTQKPVKLYEWLLTNYAKPGDRILDTHFGSGSHGVACNNLGFELDAVELDEDYYKASVERLKNEFAQVRLF